MERLGRKGITIIEFIIVISIVGILAAVSSLYISETINLWQFLSFRNELVSQERMALMRMVREIRQINDDFSVITANAARFQFDDINDNRIDYRLQGVDLMRNTDVLISGVDSLAFTYYDENNTVIGAPVVSPGRTNIYRIEITLTVRFGNQSKTLTSRVYPRNL